MVCSSDLPLLFIATGFLLEELSPYYLRYANNQLVSICSKPLPSFTVFRALPYSINYMKFLIGSETSTFVIAQSWSESASASSLDITSATRINVRIAAKLGRLLPNIHRALSADGSSWTFQKNTTHGSWNFFRRHHVLSRRKWKSSGHDRFVVQRYCQCIFAWLRFPALQFSCLCAPPSWCRQCNQLLNQDSVDSYFAILVSHEFGLYSTSSNYRCCSFTQCSRCSARRLSSFKCAAFFKPMFASGCPCVSDYLSPLWDWLEDRHIATIPTVKTSHRCNIPFGRTWNRLRQRGKDVSALQVLAVTTGSTRSMGVFHWHGVVSYLFWAAVS